MPELPEVETIRQSLEGYLINRRIEALEILHPDVYQNPRELEIVGRQIVALTRQGKYLRIELDDQSFLLIHLRMTGRLLIHPAPAEPSSSEYRPHTHLRFTLRDEAGEISLLDYQDVRRFGRVGHYLLHHDVISPGYKSLGPDAFSPEFTSDHLYNYARRFPARPIKALLLDQSVVAGLGNIYVDESLFRAGIRPNRRSGQISRQRLQNLHREIVAILKESIGLGGTSFSDYVDGLGRRGSFIQNLSVYGKKGKNCPHCGQPLKCLKIAGRTTVYCTHCQR